MISFLLNVLFGAATFVAGFVIARRHIERLEAKLTEADSLSTYWEQECSKTEELYRAEKQRCREQRQQLKESASENNDQHSRLNRVQMQLSEEQEKCCRYVERLNATEAKLADAELRIEAATENLANKPVDGVVIEDECPF